MYRAKNVAVNYVTAPALCAIMSQRTVHSTVVTSLEMDMKADRKSPRKQRRKSLVFNF